MGNEATKGQVSPQERGAPAQVLDVTQGQFDSIEAAFRICSMRSGRKVQGQFVSLFDDAVASVLGFAPPDAYSLNVVTTGTQP